MPHITASILYNYINCPHRVWRDLHGPMDEKVEEDNPFLQLLWERGVQHEDTVIRDKKYFDASKGTLKDRKKMTLEAMRNKEPLIYQGVLFFDNMHGIPDLLELQSDGSYLPVDVKSGLGVEGVDDEEGEGKLKKTYAVQLALYSDMLQHLGFSTRKMGKIIDSEHNEVVYDLKQPRGKREKQSWWDFYVEAKKSVWALLSNFEKNDPALQGACKLCHWYKSCKTWVKDTGDVSGLFYVGRSKRDVLREDLHMNTIDDMRRLDVSEVMERKKDDKGFLKGVGEATLDKIIRRAHVMKFGKPVLYEKITFPEVVYELYFDIEDDPTQDFVYMHGVYEKGPEGERFVDFTATELTPEAEKKAWSDFWAYIRSFEPGSFAVYYYSAHEKSTYRHMRERYPDVVSEEELEAFFDNPNVIDLYSQIILKKTDWPVSSYSVKEIAQFLGFSWRDVSPSGALSIQWFNDFIATGDESIKTRILEYNEDDCKAMLVIKEGIERLNSM